MLTHHFSKKALGSLKGHSASMKCAKLYKFKISTFSTILDWKLQWFGQEKYCTDHKSGVFTPFQCEFLQNISDLIIFNIKWPNVGVSFKKYAKKKKKKIKKIEICTQKKWETCLIWSFLAKMDRWQDVTSLSWVQLMLEIKHHKAMIALPILPFQICGSTGGLTMALALPWGTVSPGEGGGEVLVCSSSVEEQAETVPCLNSPGTRWDPEISWPSPPPDSVLTGPPIS